MTTTDLTSVPQEKWDHLAEEANKNPLVLLYLRLAVEKKCVHCSVKFPQGIVRRGVPAEHLKDAWHIFSTEYLVHCSQTH